MINWIKQSDVQMPSGVRLLMYSKEYRKAPFLGFLHIHDGIIDLSYRIYVKGVTHWAEIESPQEPVVITKEVLTEMNIKWVDDNPKQKPHYEGDILFTIAGHEFSNSGKDGFYSYSLNQGQVVYRYVHELVALLNVLLPKNQ